MSVRKATQGSETDLVRDFIEYYCNDFTRKKNKTHNLAVFVEPKIATGFPDVVFAEYSESIVDEWSDYRKALSVNALKILCHLIQSKGSNGINITAVLRLREKETIKALESLMDAGLIVYKDKKWCPCPIKKIFSVRKLVSIEAKLNNINRVIEQSIANTWFASHSYALTNSSTPHEETIKMFV